jgi:hypothetical protein
MFFADDKDSVKALDEFPYFEYLENIGYSQSDPPPPVSQTEISLGAGAPLIDYIAEPWERYAQGCLETNLQINPYYPFGMREVYKYIDCRIKMKRKKT